MSDANLQGVEACVFDAYGTLLDFNSAVAAHEAELGSKASAVSDLWRRKQLEYTWLRSLMQRYQDFWQVTADALDYTLETLAIDDSQLRDRLLQAYRSLRPYPEVPQMLARLRADGVKTAILSNGSPEMLADGVESAGISASLDAIFSVEDVGIFKPAPEVYQIATSNLGVAADHVLFLSSNAWDVHGASTFGFRCIWVNRGNAAAERLPNGPIRILGSLEPLPDLIAAA